MAVSYEILLLLRHYWKKHFTAAEATRQIIKYEGEGSLEERTARRWFQKFTNGDTTLERKKGSGRRSMDIDEIMDIPPEQQEAVESNPSNSTRELSRESVQKSPHELTPQESAKSFPRDPVTRQKWVIAMKRKDFVPNSSSRVCSKHFTPDQLKIRPNSTLELLRLGSVPSVFNFSSELTHSSTRKKQLINEAQGEPRSTEQNSDGDQSESGTSQNTTKEPPTKKQELEPVARQNQLLKLACDLLSTNTKEESNECLEIGRVWGTKLMSLDSMQRKFAEKAINDILFEADMGTLHRNSVQINSYSNLDPLGGH